MKKNMIHNAQDLILDMQKNFENINRESKVGADFIALVNKIYNDGYLDSKTKALMAIALSVQKQCKWCITYNVKKAMDLGSTKEEMLEAGFMAVALSGFSAYAYVQILIKSIEDLMK